MKPYVPVLSKTFIFYFLPFRSLLLSYFKNKVPHPVSQPLLKRRWSNWKPLEGSVASCYTTAVPFSSFSPHLFLGIAKWLNAFYTHTNTCTHTNTAAQCCDLDSFWFLSADDWQVLNESSLERLPSRPVHQPSTYNARTHTQAHAHSLTYLYTNIYCINHTHTSTLSLQTFSVLFPRLDQFLHSWGSVWQSLGDGSGLALLLCFYEAGLSNTEGMSAAPLCSKVHDKHIQHHTIPARTRWSACACMCALVCSYCEGHSDEAA